MSPPAHGGASAEPPPNSPGRRGSGSSSSTHSCQPGGAGGQDGSGCQWGGGTKPGGGGGQPGAGLKRRPKGPPSGSSCLGNPLYIEKAPSAEHSSQDAARCELLHARSRCDRA